MAAGNTYTPIATTTLGSAQTTITFNSFSGYTDLYCVYSTYSTNSTADVILQFNGDTGSNYSCQIIYADGTTAGGYPQNFQNQILIDYYGSAGTTAGLFNTGNLHILNYANSSTYKTIINRAGRAAAGVDIATGLWRSSSAITSFTLKLGGTGNNFAAGSTFSLYGITAA